MNEPKETAADEAATVMGASESATVRSSSGPDGEVSRTHALHVVQARNFRQRLIGLLGAAPLPHGHALRLAPCRAVHTVGMRHPIDVVFVDAHHRVCAVRASLPPSRVAACLQARAVFELRNGEADRLGIRPGDRVVSIGTDA